MKDLWQIVVGILGSIGTAGAIILALSSWLGKIWAERMMAKESAKYREELERLTKQLERKNYVSKVRFDAEFSIYRELSGAFLDVVRAQNDLFTFEKMDRVPAEKYEQKKLYEERFGKGADAYNNASTQLHRSAPFIEENIFEQFRNILRDVRRQLLHYPAFYIEDDALETQRECQTLFEECTKRTQTINDEMDKLISDLREYLKKLDVA